MKTITEFIQQLAFPETSRVNDKVFKRLFYEHGQLTSADKKLFAEDVDDITCLYMLTPKTIAINAFHDDDRVYDEIAVLLVKLRKQNSAPRIASLIQRTIPYPVILLISYQEQLMLQLADKRINKADSSKLVIADSISSDWLNLNEPAIYSQAFINTFSIKQLRYSHLYHFYQDWMQALLNLNSAKYVNKNLQDQLGDYVLQRQTLEQIETTQSSINELRKKIKAANQLNEQTRLNIQIKSLQNTLEELKTQL
tara:strand:- start:1135 stop:1893 length:759 start_codon:yes stop_codon:yes gene_type:complete